MFSVIIIIIIIIILLATVCVARLSLLHDHAMICRHGGLTFVRHNDLRDTTAQMFVLMLQLSCSIPYAYFVPYAYGTYTICVYAYGTTIRVWYGKSYHLSITNLVCV